MVPANGRCPCGVLHVLGELGVQGMLHGSILEWWYVCMHTLVCTLSSQCCVFVCYAIVCKCSEVCACVCACVFRCVYVHVCSDVFVCNVIHA